MDYVPTEGELVFEAGDERRTVDVALLVGGSGTYSLTVCDPSSGDELARGEARIGAAASRPAFTGRFEDLPAEHDGSVFEFAFHFSEPPAAGLSFRTMRDSFFTTTAATVTNAERITEGSNLGWRMQVEPAGLGDVNLAAAPGRACDTQGGVCTAAGRVLQYGSVGIVPGPASLSVADATVPEAVAATLDFAVTLSRARHAATTVDYATSDATAVAGEDYTAASGTLTFVAGEIKKTIEVAVLNDSHDEGAETMTLTLSKAASPTRIARAEATGTIKNSDAMPRAWLARFGRAVSEQVLDAVEGRLAASRLPGIEASVAGQRVGAGASADELHRRAAEARAEALTSWLTSDGERGVESREVTERDIVAGSSLALTGGTEQSGSGSLWAGGAVSRCDGREGALTLSGEVASGVLWACTAAASAPRWVCCSLTAAAPARWSRR